MLFVEEHRGEPQQPEDRDQGCQRCRLGASLVLWLAFNLERHESCQKGCWISRRAQVLRQPDPVLDLFLGVTDGADFDRKQVGDTNHTAQFAYRLLRLVAVQIPIDFARKSHMPLISCDPNGIVADLPSKDT